MPETIERSSSDSRDQQFFDKYADGYSPYSESDLDLVLAPLLREWRSASKLRVLEVGCASGQFSQTLAARLDPAQVSIWGLDICLTPLRQFPFNGVCGSAREMPFRDAAFDVVCCPASLHHLYPFEIPMQEISRVLKPGGLFYCMEPNLLHPQRMAMRMAPALYHRFWRDADDTPLSVKETQRLCHGTGLDPEFHQYITLEFREPGPLQRLQNRVSVERLPRWLSRFAAPWFLFTARRVGDAGSSPDAEGNSVLACPVCYSSLEVQDNEFMRASPCDHFRILEDGIPCFIDDRVGL